MHEVIAQAAWFGELAMLHPLFVGAPIVAGLAAGWLALRRRRTRLGGGGGPALRQPAGGRAGQQGDGGLRRH
jgi:hypothetical protein